MRFLHRLNQVVLNATYEERLYLNFEMAVAAKSGYQFSDAENRLWNQLGFLIGGK